MIYIYIPMIHKHYIDNFLYGRPHGSSNHLGRDTIIPKLGSLDDME